MSWIFLSCYPQPQSEERLEPYLIGNAQITEAAVTCEEDTWTVEIKTDAWTSNGSVWIVQSSERYEKHPIYSIGAAADGSSDHLRMVLKIIPEWREAVGGNTSGWLCVDQESLSIAIVIYHGENNHPNDCVYFGEDVWGEFPSIDQCSLWN